MNSFAKYWHTLRYLRPVQIFGRIRFTMLRPRPDERPAPPVRATVRAYAAPIGANQSMLSADRFCLLNQEGTCSQPADWQASGHSHLWIYNLHYFDDLNAVNFAQRRAWHESLMVRWVKDNPPGVGVGWDSYPLSKRMVNWIKWSLSGAPLSPAARQSLAVQSRWLARRIESHLQGNHVMANAKALVHAGLYFVGDEAEGWLRQGIALMLTEVAEEVLTDGGHFERSPMYHAGFIEDLLDTLNVMQAYGYAADSRFSKAAASMMRWLGTMSHPDSGIAFFNDSSFGVAPGLPQLVAYAARFGIRSEPLAPARLTTLSPSGYVVAELDPFYLLCDIAPIGPDHLPAHAHADTLSFELSFSGRRTLVNSGTSEYGLSIERHRQRGTAAHNTLVIDGENSSEVWAGFRVARRARARLLEARSESSIVIVGEHDGYRRLRGRNLHRRSWTLSAQELLIEDTVEGPFASAECYFHLHPDIHPTSDDFGVDLGDPGGGHLRMRFEGAIKVEVRDSTWHPRFGASQPNRCIVARLAGSRLVTYIGRSDLN